MDLDEVLGAGQKLYIINFNPDLFVHVLMPKVATLTTLTSNERVSVGLSVTELGRNTPLLFGPDMSTESARGPSNFKK